MIDNVLQISREQMEKAIEILNPCMNDYIYVYDLIDDYYVISGHAVDRFILPEDKFYDAAAKSSYMQMIMKCLVRNFRI